MHMSMSKCSYSKLLYFLCFFLFKKYLLLFNYSCMPFLPISPHPQLNPPPSPTSTLLLDFVHVSFIVVPVIPSPHCPLPTPPWKQPKCPSANEWIQKLWYIHTMEFYAAERKKELLPFATAWMELESIMRSEISQAVRDKYHMISPLTGT